MDEWRTKGVKEEGVGGLKGGKELEERVEDQKRKGWNEKSGGEVKGVKEKGA